MVAYTHIRSPIGLQIIIAFEKNHVLHAQVSTNNGVESFNAIIILMEMEMDYMLPQTRQAMSNSMM